MGAVSEYTAADQLALRTGENLGVHIPLMKERLSKSGEIERTVVSAQRVPRPCPFRVLMPSNRYIVEIVSDGAAPGVYRVVAKTARP